MSIFHIFQSGVHFVNPQEIDAERIDYGTFTGMILANFKLGFSGQNEVGQESKCCGKED